MRIIDLGDHPYELEEKDKYFTLINKDVVDIRRESRVVYSNKDIVFKLRNDNIVIIEDGTCVVARNNQDKIINIYIGYGGKPSNYKSKEEFVKEQI